MRKMRYNLSILVAFTVMLGGCASDSLQRRAYDGYENVSPSLVTSSLSGVHGWEASRNDPPMRLPAMHYDVTEIRHWETLRTTDARPREYTTTRSRSIRWFQSP